VQNDQPRASQLYQRYVKEGAAVPFAEDFGRQCAEPDFAAAKRFPFIQAWRTSRYWLHQHLYVPVIVLLIAGGLIVAVRVRSRRVGS
jgi:hypothetical protein